jgi:hypothetical protein
MGDDQVFLGLVRQPQRRAPHSRHFATKMLPEITARAGRAEFSCTAILHDHEQLSRHG